MENLHKIPKDTRGTIDIFLGRFNIEWYPLTLVVYVQDVIDYFLPVCYRRSFSKNIWGETVATNKYYEHLYERFETLGSSGRLINILRFECHVQWVGRGSGVVYKHYWVIKEDMSWDLIDSKQGSPTTSRSVDTTWVHDIDLRVCVLSNHIRYVLISSRRLLFTEICHEMPRNR